jgi:hypothetical protein
MLQNVSADQNIEIVWAGNERQLDRDFNQALYFDTAVAEHACGAMTSSVHGRYDNIWGNIAHGLSVHHGSARSGVHEAVAIWDDHIAIYSNLYARAAGP